MWKWKGNMDLKKYEGNRIVRNWWIGFKAEKGVAHLRFPTWWRSRWQTTVMEIGRGLEGALVSKNKKELSFGNFDLGSLLKLNTRNRDLEVHVDTQDLGSVPLSPIQQTVGKALQFVASLILAYSILKNTSESFPSLCIFTMLSLPPTLWKTRFDFTTCWTRNTAC